MRCRIIIIMRHNGGNLKNLLVTDWIKYLESIKENSSNTIRSYELDIIQFLQFQKHRHFLSDFSIDEVSNIDINEIDEDFIKKINVRDIIAYINYTDKVLENAAPTRSRKLSSLRSFYSYLHKIIAIIDENPMSLIDGPKIPKRLPHYLELEEVKDLLEAILRNKDDYYRSRDYAIVMLFLNTGLRLSELVNLSLNHLQSEDSSLRVIGKGNKERSIYLNDSVKEAINDYLDVRPDSDLNNVFLNKSGSDFLGQRGIQYMLSKYLKECGLAHKYSPHSLRHTAATLLYQYGNVDIRTLQVILGHESVSTTQIYTHVSNKQVETALESNPIKDLELDI